MNANRFGALGVHPLAYLVSALMWAAIICGIASCHGCTTRNYNVTIFDPKANITFEFLVERTTTASMPVSLAP